ncbi:hypothetical protein PSTG_14399 [Puccinia striiformis f. sp. tritici PST-78]|uniref:Uncharacterized protein n=1 Tax=Puccinia striiformis f. sp. tritici PST-78 TaxID=1165861 RepID=A0A0L0UZM9_9BASI|nr:hypothetical protein PSTG_14399 [Puccinia striiformis f. sp. tritici PST-78]
MFLRLGDVIFCPLVLHLHDSARLDAIDQPKGEYHHGSSSPSPLGPCFTIDLKLPFPTESFPIRVSNNVKYRSPIGLWISDEIAMEGHGGSDSWASMRDEYQPQTNPHPSDHSIHSSTPNSSLPQFHSGDGGTYNYHHGRQSFPGEQLHNSSPSYYQPNQPGTGHTMGSPAVDGNPPGIGPQGVGGHTYSNSTPVGPLGHNGSGHTIGSQGDGNQPGGGGPTTVPQGRRGNPYNIKFPNQPPQSPHTYPCHEHANELISYAIGTTPVGPLGRNSSIDSGGIGPIRSPRIGTGGASPSPYRHEGRQLFSDEFSSSREFDRQSTSSGGYQSRDRQHSRDLDTPPASLRPETATWICENFKALRDCVGKPEEMVKMAQPLFNIPENERWPASVVMQLCWLGSFADIPQVALEKAAALKGQPITSLTTFITTTVRRVLLSPELDSFGRQSSLKNAGGKTPYSLVKDAIDAQSTGWLETHLSVKWREVGELVEKVEQAIIKRLKSDKNVLATIIKTGLANPNGVPRLRKLVSEVYGQMHSRYKDVEPRKIAGDKEITSAARARLAYLRLLIHLNQLEHERVKGTKNAAPPHFWTAIEEDLARCVGKPAIYKVAFGLLIIAKDRALWGNGTTLAKDITADQAALPTEEEIATKIAKLNGHTNEDEGGDDESDDGSDPMV